MPDEAERGIFAPVPDNQQGGLLPAGAPGEGLEFLDEHLGLLRPCSNDARYDVMDGVEHGAYDCLVPPTMMTDPPITWGERGPAAVPGEGLEFVDNAALDEYFCLPSSCSTDTYCDAQFQDCMYKVYDDLLPRTIMPNSRIAWDDVYKLDETEGGDSSANVPLIMPAHNDQDRGMGPVAAHREGLEFVDGVAFDEYLGLHPPRSNDTYYDDMDGATYKVHDDLLPRTITPDSRIAWDDVYRLEFADVQDDQDRGMRPVASHGEGLEFADQVAFDDYLGVHPPHSMTGAGNMYYDAMDDFVFPPPKICIPRISWDDSYDHKKKRKTQKITWTGSLHEQFVEVVNKLGGVDHAVPKRIVELMDHPGLTSKIVASHLQKYRNGLKKEITPEEEKVEACLRRFPESNNYQGLHQPPLQESTDLAFAPIMLQQPMNIRNATYMEPPQIGAMPGYSFPEEPISGHLYGSDTQMPRQRQNIFLPEQQPIGHVHGNISDYQSFDNVDSFGELDGNVDSFGELDGNFLTHASSFESFDNAD